MSNLAYKESYNVEDHNLWKGDWELIHGDAYAMSPSPAYGHQFVNLKIARQLDEKLDGCKKCSAVIEMDLELSHNTVVRPDSMVICYEPKDRLTLPPEIVFEVVSNSSSRRDEILKFNLYQDEGIKYFVLAYPKLKKAKVYQLIDFKYQKVGDFQNESFKFENKECNIDFDFGFIWQK